MLVGYLTVLLPQLINNEQNCLSSRFIKRYQTLAFTIDSLTQCPRAPLPLSQACYDHGCHLSWKPSAEDALNFWTFLNQVIHSNTKSLQYCTESPTLNRGAGGAWRWHPLWDAICLWYMHEFSPRQRDIDKKTDRWRKHIRHLNGHVSAVSASLILLVSELQVGSEPKQSNLWYYDFIWFLDVSWCPAFLAQPHSSFHCPSPPFSESCLSESTNFWTLIPNSTSNSEKIKIKKHLERAWMFEPSNKMIATTRQKIQLLWSGQKWK